MSLLPVFDTYEYYLHPINFSRQMSSMERDMQRLEREFEKAGKRFKLDMGGELGMNMRPSSLEEHRSLTNPIIEDNQGNRKLHLTFDLRNFKPEEIHVTTKDGALHVEAKHDWKDDNHTVSRQYSRSYLLPKDLKMEEMKSEFKPNGSLVVEGPLPRKAIEDKQMVVDKPNEPTAIAITHE